MYTGKLNKDFEEYLVKNKLWTPYKEEPMVWIQRIGNLMEKAAKRTAKENSVLSKEDYQWWVDLVNLQNFYGHERDIFGEYIEIKGMTSQKSGQFFTPMSICRMMSSIMYSGDIEEGEGTISDPTCGSGRMMIAHAINARDKGMDAECYTYYNQDIDYKSFIFTTLNAAMRNLCSIVVWGDTLAMKEYKVYITIPTNLGMALWMDRDHELVKRNIVGKLNLSKYRQNNKNKV